MGYKSDVTLTNEKKGQKWATGSFTQSGFRLYQWAGFTIGAFVMVSQCSPVVFTYCSYAAILPLLRVLTPLTMIILSTIKYWWLNVNILVDFWCFKEPRPPESTRITCTAVAGCCQMKRTRCRVLLFFSGVSCFGLSNRVTFHWNDQTGRTGMHMTKKYKLNSHILPAVSF